MTTHVTIYRQADRFAGWPANHGIWSWGDEILVGFAVGRFLDREHRFHAIDMHSPRGIMFGRSRNGGKTWEVEDGTQAGLAAACYNHTLGTDKPKVCPGQHDFTGPGFGMIFGRLRNAGGPSCFHVTENRGRTWLGPYLLPDMGTPGIAARTSYVVDGPKSMTAFFCCAKENGREGRSFAAGTFDGGASWQRYGFFDLYEPRGYSIMPSGIRLADGRLICAVRNQWRANEPGPTGLGAYRRRSCIDILASPLIDPTDPWVLSDRLALRQIHSSPSWLVDLEDGRICCVYTVREKPFRICAAIAPVDTLKFGPEIVVCDDAVSRDIGYAVACRRPDGKLVIVYYWHDNVEGPERYIRATIWEPPK